MDIPEESDIPPLTGTTEQDIKLHHFLIKLLFRQGRELTHKIEMISQDTSEARAGIQGLDEAVNGVHDRLSHIESLLIRMIAGMGMAGLSLIVGLIIYIVTGQKP